MVSINYGRMCERPPEKNRWITIKIYTANTVRYRLCLPAIDSAGQNVTKLFGGVSTLFSREKARLSYVI